MDSQNTLQKIKQEIDNAKSIAIITRENPTADTVGSTLAFYLGLIGIGKTASVVCATPMTVEYSNFVGANKLETTLSGKKNFVISLDYQEGSIDKVSYNIEGNTFNLVIEPRPGFEDFSSDKVRYKRSGGAADLLIVIDAETLEELGSVYQNNKELFAEKPIVNIGYREKSTMLGAMNLIDKNVSSMTELAAVVMSFCGVKLTEDIASNLFNAIASATDNFQSEKVNARTFEVASVCMKAGAKRFAKRIDNQTPQMPVTLPTNGAPPANQQPNKPQPQQNPQPSAQKPQEDEWLKPKIFKNPNANV